jgi:hypothetical protein
VNSDSLRALAFVPLFAKACDQTRSKDFNPGHFSVDTCGDFKNSPYPARDPANTQSKGELI